MGSFSPSRSVSLSDYMCARLGADANARGAILSLAAACAEISALVARGSLADILGTAGAENVQGEDQQKLDVIVNDVLVAAAEQSGCVAAIASEELEDVVVFANGGHGRVLLLFDPLDGSSNIDVNVSIGTIFSILPARETAEEITANAFLQMGRAQLAAGYVVYGPQTTLVLTLHDGVAGFTLDPADGCWRLTQPTMRISRQTREFSINMSNQRHWAEPLRRYIDECLAGKAGPRGKDYNMRWVGSMVADMHRIVSRGGVFLYP